MTRRRPDRNILRTLAAMIVIAAIVPIGTSGCNRRAAKAPAPPPPPPTRKLDPLEDLDMDPRVQFPAAREPSTRELAEAIADFGSALVSGDHAAFSDMLDRSGKNVLSALRRSDQWDEATSRIETVRVCVLEQNDDSVNLGLGIQDPDGAYMLAWHGTPKGDSWVFSPMPIQDVEVGSVAMLDAIPLLPPSLSTTEDPEDSEEL